jgi:SpoVK/Ycf46/Vps4 family AAA+-type ATPase
VIDHNIGHILAVTTDPAARNLTPFDVVGWERVLAGDFEGAKVTSGKVGNTEETGKSDIRLSKSQQKLLGPLKAFWRIKREGKRVAGYDPRPIPLIVGPSGSGKTALVRHFAALEELPMKDFNVGTWLVSGAKTEPQTLSEIADFLDGHEHGVLFIDEVDKLFGSTDWTRHVQQEIYALLDARTDSFPGWGKSLRQKLIRNFFIIGAGTWQARYEVRRRLLGFGGKKPTDPWDIDVEAQNEIPEELLMRFNADILRLRPLEKEEFVERIREIHDELKIPQLSEERLSALAEKATASGRHNRWLEAYLSRRLRETEEHFVEPELLHVVRRTPIRRRG